MFLNIGTTYVLVYNLRKPIIVICKHIQNYKNIDFFFALVTRASHAFLHISLSLSLKVLCKQYVLTP